MMHTRLAIAMSGALALFGCATARTSPANSPGVDRIPGTILARGELLAESRRLVRGNNVYLLPAYRALLRSADSVMTVTPQSVMQKKNIPPSGDRHDFLSLAPYWWPDSTKINGVPYIRRDGEMNPQSRIDHDGLRFQKMEDAVEILSLAWYLGGNEKHAKRAATLLHGWFIDPETRMNPNLNFAQTIPGVSEGRGIGIIDLRHVPQLLDAVKILELSGKWEPSNAQLFLKWCRDYLQWLKTSKNGQEEFAAENNHGTWYDSQAAAFALFVGDTAFARQILASSARSRVARQFAADGSQPLELERTRPIHYSLFNLDPFTQLAEMGRHVGADLWNYRSPSSGSILGGLHFTAPFADTSHRWTKPELVPVTPDEVAIPLARARAATSDKTLARAADTSASLGGRQQRWRLLYPGAHPLALTKQDSLYAHALAYAQSQLKRSASTLDPSAGLPRSTRADGSWEQRPFNQWTSGFFPGSLWYMYQLTRAPEWRSLAERWTAPLEPAKSITTTHDLGFMIYNSFGHGFALTTNPAYRAVVLDASRSLATRFNSRVGAIKSWDTERVDDPRRTWKYPVIIDNLMNLEMLFESAKLGDGEAARIATSHALTSAKAHVRPDGSTAHVALFDPASGKLERTVTWQGFADSSAWSRGQAWAIHGFTAAYANTARQELLRAAERSADYFLAHLPPDGIPYWDLLHPAIPFTYRDASAGAIAASGLLDLSRRTDRERGVGYRIAAERILASLAASYLTEGSSAASILKHSVGNGPQNGEIDVGIVYADYYFLEALLRQRGIYWP